MLSLSPEVAAREETVAYSMAEAQELHNRFKLQFSNCFTHSTAWTVGGFHLIAVRSTIVYKQIFLLQDLFLVLHLL